LDPFLRQTIFIIFVVLAVVKAFLGTGGNEIFKFLVDVPKTEK